MTTSKNGAAQRVSPPTSEQRIPVGSKAIRHTGASKWIELTIGVKPVRPILQTLRPRRQAAGRKKIHHP